MTVELTTPVLNPVLRHLLSSTAGCTFGLTVKRFSAMLVSKSTYMFQIRDEVQLINTQQSAKQL